MYFSYLQMAIPDGIYPRVFVQATKVILEQLAQNLWRAGKYE